MKINFKKLLPVLIICFFGITFHYNHMNDYPSHTHAWAQSDRYAISKNFVNNGLNLFEPETYLLNPQFPDFWETPQKESITSVDFPIHDYIPAIFMKITGIDSPWLVRLYNLLYSFLGLFFLYKLALLYLNNELKALFIIGFAATSPVFIFYQNSFLPTIPSLANTIISIYFYAKFSKNDTNKNFNLSILFGSLAALSRTTFVIPLIAIFCLEFTQIIRKKSTLTPKITPVVISFSALIGYYFYNKYLRSIYGSSFLNSLMNADNFEAFIFKLKQSLETWGMEYFSNIHYFSYLILILSSVVIYVLLKPKTSYKLKKFNLFLTILILGNLFFIIAMIHQFILHDYYFLDSLYLPLILLLIPFLSLIPNLKTSTITERISVVMMALIIGFFITKQGIESQKERYTHHFWENDKEVVENYQLADEALTDLGYGKDAKVLIFESFAPNLPLLTMDRKGFAIMTNRTSTINKAMSWDYDIIVIQNEQFVSKILPVYPDILNKLTKVWGNDKITICKPKENDFNFSQFFGLTKRTTLIESILNFEDGKNSEWLNIKTTSIDKFSGDSSTIVLPEMTNGPVFAKHLGHFFETEKTVVFEGKFKFTSESKASIIICVSTPSQENAYYKVKDLTNTNHEWKTVKLLLNIPKIKSKTSEFKFYLHNQTELPFFMDNVSLKIL